MKENKMYTKYIIPSISIIQLIEYYHISVTVKYSKLTFTYSTQRHA